MPGFLKAINFKAEAIAASQMLQSKRGFRLPSYQKYLAHSMCQVLLIAPDFIVRGATESVLHSPPNIGAEAPLKKCTLGCEAQGDPALKEKEVRSVILVLSEISERANIKQ